MQKWLPIMFFLRSIIYAIKSDGSISLISYLPRIEIRRIKIPLHFDLSEELRADNIDETLIVWQKICRSHIEFLCHKDDIIAENKNLKAKLLEMPENKTTLNNEDISEIQCFSDKYNRLFDNGYNVITLFMTLVGVIMFSHVAKYWILPRVLHPSKSEN